ncbi:MAG TPA: acyl-CoA dehydrogenase [Burkholderiaceae bacterium]|nr:acyl-CoA dehydrogenase [Burkholderiaceae bacterium]
MIDLRTRLDALSDDDRLVLDSARDYAGRDPELKRVRALRDQRPSHDPQAWRTLAEMGWLGCRLPESLQGTPLSFVQLSLLLEQFGGSLAPEPLTPAVVLAGGLLLASGNEALKAQWLPKLAAGDWLPSYAGSEAKAAGPTAAGGAAANAGEVATAGATAPVAPQAPTRLAATAEGYELTGRKAFVANGESADAFIVSAAGPAGTTLVLVPRNAHGVEVVVRPRIDGGTWSELHCTGVAVGQADVIASGPAADALIEQVLDETRLAISAELVGLMSRAFDLTVDYVKLRKQFDQPVGAFQAVQHRAVDLLVQVELARAVLRQSAQRFDAAPPAPARALIASQVKARCSDAALKVLKGCVQLHGGIAYTDECNVGMFLKRAMVLAAWLGGASEHRRRFGRLVESGAGAQSSAQANDPFVTEVEQWLAANFPPEWRFPPNRLGLAQAAPWQQKLGAKGWAAPGWPKEFGGMGLSAYDQVRMADAFDRHGISIVPNMGITMLGPLLIRYGTDEQRRTHLPGILAGTTRWCQGYSEPGAGSDLAGLRTSAVLDGDSFVVNGQKIWTSFAHEADWIFLLVRTDPKAKKQKGISFLLVNMRSPGITVRRIRNLTGESEFCEVFFDNVRVPAHQRVGALNQGWTMAKALLGSERISIGSPRLARYPLQLLRDLLVSRGQLDDPVIRARYDELQLDVEDLGALFVRMAEVLRRGEELGAEVSMLKLWVSEAMQRVTDAMLELGGEQATLDEPMAIDAAHSVHVANQYFASRPATIYGGSSEIQRNILARAVLELPDA